MGGGKGVADYFKGKKGCVMHHGGNDTRVHTSAHCKQVSFQGDSGFTGRARTLITV